MLPQGAGGGGSRFLLLLNGNLDLHEALFSGIGVLPPHMCHAPFSVDLNHPEFHGLHISQPGLVIDIMPGVVPTPKRLVRQNIVGLLDVEENLHRLRVFVLVRMVLQGHLPICTLDFLQRRVFLYAQHFVVALGLLLGGTSRGIPGALHKEGNSAAGTGYPLPEQPDLRCEGVFHIVAPLVAEGLHPLHVRLCIIELPGLLHRHGHHQLTPQ
mmetsp:Transcript_96903/g.278325  ORF Transcript_96903/g.278325 Transcript_96903/m.278325 type:complete len:212 (+) Transcript_96903:72-707(+)